MERYAVAVRLLRLTITVSGRTPIARGKHPVQRADSNRDLGRLTSIGAESQTVLNDTFEAADV
ncbi:MAG: hypothetical protein EOO77_44770 [Oxalobacteraceae bacterium]|nr:MAG: hypothetical protein EOO77_44770 [Oxalobacteraceae bacterium]